MAWCFEDEATRATERILDRLVDSTAYVPAVWPLEITNVLLVAERKNRLTEAQSFHFLEILQSLPIVVEVEETRSRAFKETLSLARQFGLSSYDATYLELAARKGLSLATLDKGLKTAAKSCGIKIL